MLVGGVSVHIILPFNSVGRFLFSVFTVSFSVSSEYFLMFLVFLLVVVVFLSVIQVWVPTWVLTFCLWSSRGLRFFHRLILLPRILNRLTPWCRLSGYLSISRSLSQFLTWLSSSLVPEKRQCGFLFRHESSNGVYISFYLLVQCLCLCVCIAWVIVVFGLEFLAFLYLVSLLMCLGFFDVFDYIFVDRFPVFQGQKTNHSLLLS